MLGGRSNEQHGAPLALIVESPAAAKDAFAVFPQDLRATVRVRNVQRMRHHPSASGIRALSFGPRQRELKYSAPWLVRFRPQLAPMSMDDGAANRQPHACSTRLRGVESVEDPIEMRRIDARPRIAHGHKDAC